MVSSPRPLSYFVRLFSTVLVMLVLISGLISQGSFIFESFKVPQADASSPSFHDFFEDCTDDDNEVTWAQIKACLNNPSNALDNGSERTRWNNAIRNKLETFFDNHGTTGPGYELPGDFISKPYVYGSSTPNNATQDRIIDIYLREESGGMDGAQEIGTFLSGSNGGYLCTLLNIPPGGSSTNTDSLPSPYAGLALYGPSRDGDTPRCTRADILNNDEKPYLVRGFSAALLWVLADSMSNDAALAEQTRSLFGTLKTYLQNPPASAVQTVNSSQYVDLTGFYEQNYDRGFGNGPIENMMQACQGDAQVTSTTSGTRTDEYVTQVANCYDRNIPTLERAGQFVREVLQPATVELAAQYRTWSAEQKTILRTFMASTDYIQLAEGYDPLAQNRFDYRLEDYLDETINDGYTDSSDFVYDTENPDQVATSLNATIGYRSNFDDAVKKPILYQLMAVNRKLIERSTTYLDRPLPTPPPPSTAVATGRAAFQSQLAQINRTAAQSRKNVLEQMNDYINRTITNNKDTMLFAWYYMAVASHDPNYPNAVEHRTGDLSLLVEDRPGTGAWATIFTDPFLAAVTNACSPNVFFDTINKENFPAWKRCLEHEKDYVDHSDTNKAHKPQDRTSRNNFTMTLAGSAEPFKMRRSESVRTALSQLIARIDACNANPVCLTLNDRNEGAAANRDANLPDDGRDTGNSLLNSILAFINVLVALLIKFVFWLAAMVMSLFQAVLSYTGFTTSSFVITMWKAIRDFVNLFFILALLIVAVANIVQYQINNYAIKTILPKLILIVIAVNFSRLFVGIVIDAANVVEAGVYQVGGMGPHGAGGSAQCSQYTPAQNSANSWRLISIPNNVKQGSILCRLAQGLKFEDMQRYIDQNDANRPGNQVDFFLANMALLLMGIMILFGFLALAITFTIRIVILWALAITSPLYVVGNLFPFTSSVVSQWQGKFFKYATLHVGVAFFLTLAVLAADSVVPQIFSETVTTPGAVAGSTLGPAGFQTMADYLKLLFIIAMVYAGVFTAAKGDYAQGLIDRVAGLGSNPLAGAKFAAKWGIGAPSKVLGLVGNRLENVRGSGRVGRGLAWLTRGAGHVLALPSNVGGGVKNIAEDLKKGAEDRRKRSQLSAAAYLSGGRFTRRGEKFRSILAQHREGQISETEKLESNLYDTRRIQSKLLDESIGKGDSQSLMARARILASRGALDLDKIMENGKSLRDNIKSLELANGVREEEADSALERMQETNLAAIANKKGKKAQEISTTGETGKNLENVINARERQQVPEFMGLISKALASGRVSNKRRVVNDDGTISWVKRRDGTDDEGTGLAFQQLLLALADNMNISADDWRLMNKEVAGQSMSMFGVQLKDKGIFNNYIQGKDGRGGVFGAAKRLGFFANHDTYAEAMQSDERDEVAKIMGHLATEGAYQGRALEDIAEGQALLRSTRDTHAEKVGTIKLDGDDDRVRHFVKQMDAQKLGDAINASVTSSPQMVVKAMEGLIQNIVKARTPEAKQYHEVQLNATMEHLAKITTTQAQIDQLAPLIETALGKKLASNTDDEFKGLFGSLAADGSVQLNTTGQNYVDQFKTHVLAEAKKRREELEADKERVRARIQAEEQEKVRQRAAAGQPPQNPPANPPVNPPAPPAANP
ncbi:MAG: hypothetical protein HY817_01170 [Candidatus Abawacabacteria bacterium]|nr:hypothetical protein [Candidatus Abawacabacteria bacterium]